MPRITRRNAMKKLVLGSLNIDCTYQVEDFVRPKETISALDRKSVV